MVDPLVVPLPSEDDLLGDDDDPLPLPCMPIIIIIILCDFGGWSSLAVDGDGVAYRDEFIVGDGVDSEVGAKEGAPVDSGGGAKEEKTCQGNVKSVVVCSKRD